jgi:hypothetical protein
MSDSPSNTFASLEDAMQGYGVTIRAKVANTFGPAVVKSLGSLDAAKIAKVYVLTSDAPAAFVNAPLSPNTSRIVADVDYATVRPKVASFLKSRKIANVSIETLSKVTKDDGTAVSPGFVVTRSAK